MQDPDAGREAVHAVRENTLEMLAHRKVTPDYIVRNLKRLSKFKAKKPFNDKGIIVYSDRLDFPDVQLKASVELAQMLDMYPDKSINLKHTGNMIVDTGIRRPEDADEGNGDNGHED